MSEQKRNSLTSLGTNKKEKKSKETVKTVRFTLGLPESNEEACPEFHYSALLNSAERKRKAAKLKTDGQVNGIDPLAEDDDERLREIARRCEEKYGGGGAGGKKKHNRFDDYVDLGAGYDETDPFIDNTVAYDEVVPEELTTAHGGFYINCGALEFKEISDQSDEEVKDLKAKKRLKRVIPLPDEEEDEARKITNNVQVKKPKLQVDGQREEIIKKKKLLSHDREILKKKKKRAIDDLVKKKSVTVKELLREKRESLELDTSTGLQVSPDQKKAAVPSPSNVTKPSNKSITDAIESVVSAAREEDTSKDSASSISKSGSLISSDSEESQDGEEKEKTTTPNEEVKLPDNLSEDLKEVIVTLKRRASESAEGKCKFFSTDVNSMLLRVEHKCRTLSCSNRQAVYCHLASYLPCTKDTLMKRAKKLIIKAEEDKILEPIKKLKNAIDRMMPAVLEKYSRECQKAAEEKSVEELPSPSSDSEIGDADGKKSKVPRRRFPWTPELRALLCEVVRIKLQILELLKPRKDSVDLTLRNFLEMEVKPLWQPGWMKLSTLLRESRETHASAVMKPKKPATIKKVVTPVPVPAMPPISLGSLGNVTMQPVTAYPQTSIANNNARMKNSTSVSITMTPIPSGNSTSQLPNTAKTKPLEASAVFPHISANVAMRTKCAVPPSTQSVNVIVGPGMQIPTSVSPSYISGNVRNLPTTTNPIKQSSAPAVPNRKKVGTEVTIAKVPGSGKSSPNLQLPMPMPSVKQKVSVSPKTIDLSSSSVNRSVTVTSAPVELITSASVQKPVVMSPLPLMNIPDCISVTPTLQLPSHTTVTPSVAPPVATSTPKTIMSLKQRILQDANLEQTSVITKIVPPVVMKSEDDGIEVIEIVKDVRKTDNTKAVVKPVTKSDNLVEPKTEVRKKKKEIAKDPAPGNGTVSTPPEQPTVTPALPQEKEVDRILKEEEETAAAADYLSQINESLKNFPNNRDVYKEDQIICEDPSSPKIESPPSVLSPLSENKGSSSQPGDEKDKVNDSKGNETKPKAEETSTQDDEESVQMEMDRVMKELIQLNTRKPPDIVELDYATSQTCKVSPVATNCSSVSVTVNAPGRTQPPKSSKPIVDSAVLLPVAGRRPSTGSTDAAKMSYGFQDEFQKHLFQETKCRQEPDVSNSVKVVRSKTPVAFSQVNQIAVHSSISSRHSQNSSVEGERQRHSHLLSRYEPFGLLYVRPTEVFYPTNCFLIPRVLRGVSDEIPKF